MKFIRNWTVSILIASSFASLAEGQSLKTVTWPADIKVMRDVVYMKDGDWEGRLDVFARTSTAESAPVIIWWHGWRDSKEGIMLRILPLLEMGFSVVLPQAKDSPQALLVSSEKGAYLQRVNTARCAIHWVSTNTDAQGLSTDHLILGGFSAGAYTALMAGLGSQFEGDDVGCPGAERPSVAAIIDFFGPTSAPEGSPDDVAALQVLSQLRSGQPPLLVIHGDADNTVPFATSEALRDEATAAGMTVDFLRIPAAPHSVMNWNASQLTEAWKKVQGFLESEELLPQDWEGNRPEQQ